MLHNLCGMSWDCISRLEQESGFFFNMKYFEDQVQAGEWDEVERYLSGFTKVEDNRYSMKIFFEIRKQKYLEALDRYSFFQDYDVLICILCIFITNLCLQPVPNFSEMIGQKQLRSL